MSKVTSIGKTPTEPDRTGLDYISDIVADIKAGKMVILMDDEDRENEGELIMAAGLVRPEDINFMARYGRGLICLTLTADRCRRRRARRLDRVQRRVSHRGRVRRRLVRRRRRRRVAAAEQPR